ncbi:Oligopeptide-binding protein AppA precursor [Sporomusa ovata DSM 2662]|uniref:Oligopeptide ABC transporter, periplasmic oligopeptide-binding protein OppA (TC 3.A.1.5.1) n=1 Tax=Sporomusa ovata TaxID=2378 RepID=A0A0U1L3W2_9FIRM|nr:ABC transporter substrate-binding protein [Sporomusa ovata]EQB25835.1 oligopeptide transporter, periplasmic-binding protein OppA [Sporomusa ovata DSM 2662]CQR74397.1 Oligopeptide ABC transporter, periplasmic oligopeptide-binding protein OppA (TC 3.A.1.5.1) [Sporomusa ovata]
MKVKKWLVWGFVLVMSMVLLAGCGGEKKTATASNEKVLVYGSGDYSSINPALYEHGEINSLIFSGLTAHDKANKIIPGLAKSWSFDKATNTYTFILRNDAKWHDGHPFSADDVKFTLETIMNPKNASEIASNYEDITKIEVVDKDTIKITLKAPNVAMLDYLTIGILPKHLLEGKDIATDKFNQFPIGTGPFKMESWDKGQSIMLVKNKDFYEKEPKIDKIIFKIVEDTKARALQLKSGELDLAQVTPHDAVQFENNKDFVVDVMKTADYRGIMYNFNNPFFKENREIPNALSYAIDRKAILSSVLLGHGQIAYSPLQAGEYNNPNIEKFDYNPDKAKQELEKAGWKIGTDGIYEKNGKKLSFTINCKEGDQVRADMATICAQQLKAIGVDMKVTVQAKIDWDNQEAFLVGWGSPFDPDDHTYKVFGTDKGNNYSKYSNAKIDALLQKARETDVKADRLKYYQEFQTELTKDMPYTFITYIDALYVAKTKIKGITPDTVLGHHGVGLFWNVADWTIE